MKKIRILILAFVLSISVFTSNTIDAQASEYFDQMEYKWKENIVGNLEDKPQVAENKYVVDYIATIEKNASKAFNTMNTSRNGNSLWERITPEIKDVYLRRNFRNTKDIALAYGTKGTKFYQDEEILDLLLYSLDYLVNVEKYDGKQYYGNWWEWQVAIPNAFINTLFVIKDDISKELLDEYVDIIHKYIPNSIDMLSGVPSGQGEVFFDLKFTGKSSGANRADLAERVLGVAILKQDSKLIKQTLDSIVEIFDYVTVGDGFYKDGIFIFHGDTPYIGSYGSDLIKAVSSILSVVNGTPYDMNTETKEQFIKLVNEATLPFLHNGKIVPMMEGRAISRAAFHTPDAKGSAFIKTLALAARISNNEDGLNILKSVKYWVNEKTEYYLSISSSFEELISFIEIITEEIDLTDFKPFNGSKMFPSGDRYVNITDNNYLGLNMHSNRISAFTVGNDENRKSWHMSDGHVSLLNEDSTYGKSYWPTIDMYRLPGTTVDTKPLDDAKTPWANHKSASTWAGGANSSTNGSISMLLDKRGAQNNRINMGMDLVAQKSWFMIDGHVVSLGSGINGTSPSSIESVVENRLLDNSMDYKLLDSKGNHISNDLLALESQDFLLLKAKDVKNNIGYTFLENTDVSLKTETNTGTYYNINHRESKDIEYTESYQKIIIDHGTSAVNSKYAYIYSPGLNETEMKNVGDRFDLVKNTEDIQTVYDKTSNTTASTIWSKDGGNVDEFIFDSSLSVLVEESPKVKELYISDASQTLDKVEIKYTGEYENLILPSNVTIMNENTLLVDLSQDLGYTTQISFVKVVTQEIVDVEIIDESTGIKFSFKSDVLPENVDIIVIALSDETYEEVPTNFTFKYLVDGVEVYPNGTVKISVPVDTTLDSNYVVSIYNNGIYEPINAQIEDNFISFEVESIVKVKIEKNTVEEETNPTPPTKPDNTEDTDTLPSTGISNNLVYFIGLTLTFVGLGIVLFRKEESNTQI